MPPDPYDTTEDPAPPEFRLPAGALTPPPGSMPGALVAPPRRLAFLKWAPIMVLVIGLLGAGLYLVQTARLHAAYLGWLSGLGQQEGLVVRPVGAEERSETFREITFRYRQIFIAQPEVSDAVIILDDVEYTISRPAAWRGDFAQGTLIIKKLEVPGDFIMNNLPNPTTAPKTIAISSLNFGSSKASVGYQPRGVVLFPRGSTGGLLAIGELRRAKAEEDSEIGFRLWKTPAGLEVQISGVEAKAEMLAMLNEVFARSTALRPLDLTIDPEMLDSPVERSLKEVRAKVTLTGGALTLRAPLTFEEGSWTLKLQPGSRVGPDGRYELVTQFTADQELTTALLEQVQTAVADLATRKGAPATGDLDDVARILLADQLAGDRWTLRYTVTGALGSPELPKMQRLPLRDPAVTREAERAKINALER